jgi:hypothetical protein
MCSHFLTKLHRHLEPAVADRAAADHFAAVGGGMAPRAQQLDRALLTDGQDSLSRNDTPLNDRSRVRISCRLLALGTFQDLEDRLALQRLSAVRASFRHRRGCHGDRRTHLV